MSQLVQNKLLLFSVVALVMFDTAYKTPNIITYRSIFQIINQSKFLDQWVCPDDRLIIFFCF